LNAQTGKRQLAESYPITAYAAVNALGESTRQVVESLRQGLSGLRPCPLPVPFEAPTGALAVPPPRLSGAVGRHDSPTTRLAIVALDEVRTTLDRALARHGAERVALIVGTTTAGLARTEEAHAHLLRTGALPGDYDFGRQHAFGGLIDALRIVTGIRGPAFVVSTACSASAKALGSAQRLLAAGVVDAVLVGGVDALSQTTLRGFHSLDILSPEPCRPLSHLRRGINLGEGAAYLLLEREGEGAVRLLGVGESSDAHHMSAPHPEGIGALAAMRGALEQAGVSPGDVDHVNLHSPGTRLNDLSEARAVTALLGADVPVASTKGYTGHLLGAGGATEAIFAVVTIERGWIPQSLGADPVDTTLGLSVSTARREGRFRRVLSNSFAFGGANVSLLFGDAP
jgi:3-oxoacyl-[acyl-carrier-protein] synthase-1